MPVPSAYNPTIGELQDELLELYEMLDQRDQRIVELEQNLLQQSSSTRDPTMLEHHSSSWKKMDNDRRALISDVEKYRGESVKAREVIVDLQARIAIHTEEIDGLRQDKNQLQQQVDSQQSVLLRHQQQSLEYKKSLEDMSRKQQRELAEQYQLELQNQRLHHSIIELEENEQELVGEVEQLLQERQLMQKAHMDRTNKINELLLQLDAQCNHNKTLASENQALLDKCDAFTEAEIALKRKHEHENEFYQNQLSKLQIDLISSEQHISDLKTEIETLKSTSKYAQLEEETAQLRADLLQLQFAYDSLTNERNQLEGDLDGSCDAISILRQQHEQELLNSISKERAKWMRLEATIDNLEKSEKMAQLLALDLQEQNDELQRNIRKAEERIFMYEKDNGLEESSKYMKQLEANLSRRDEDLHILKTQLGEETDKCRTLQHTCDKLVEKFKETVVGSENSNGVILESIVRYESQTEKDNAYLRRKVSELEADRLTLMAQHRKDNLRRTCSTELAMSNVSNESYAGAELVAMKKGMEAIRSEFSELQNKCEDLLLKNSNGDTESDISTNRSDSSLVTPYIRERIDQLLLERIPSSTSNGESTASQSMDRIEKQLQCTKDTAFDKQYVGKVYDLCRDSESIPANKMGSKNAATKRQLPVPEKIARLIGALVMCLKQIDANEKDLYENSLTLKQYENDLASLASRVKLLYESYRAASDESSKAAETSKQRIEHLIQEKENYLIQISLLEGRLDTQEKEQHSNLELSRIKETMEEYKSRCEELVHELNHHRKLVDDLLEQRDNMISEKNNSKDIYFAAAQPARPNLHELLSEKDSFIEKLQSKLKETRSRLRSAESNKAADTMARIQTEHSEALGMLKQITSEFVAGSSDKEHISILRRKVSLLEQEKSSIISKYNASVEEMDKMKHALSSHLSELKEKIKEGGNQVMRDKKLKTQDLEICRLRSMVRSLQQTSARREAVPDDLNKIQELEHKNETLTESVEKLSKALMESKRSKAKIDELHHDMSERLRNTQENLAKKDENEKKLRQSLADALNLKVGALEKARKAKKMLKDLQEKIRKD